MTFQQELNSWFSPKASHAIAPSTPAIDSPAPTLIPSSSPTQTNIINPNTPTIVTFLRHCGCPFAEKTYLRLRDQATQHPTVDFIAVSHSDAPATSKWLQSLPGPHSHQTDGLEGDDTRPKNLRLVVDDGLQAYAAWGLGAAGFLHALSPLSLYQVYRLGKTEGIWNRPTESGSRWQTGGSFAVDGQGVVRWGRADARADDVPDFGIAVAKVRGRSTGAKL